MLIGAIFQTLLFALLPARYAIIPPAILLLNSVITTITQIRSNTTNGFNDDIIPGRVSAQLPNKHTAAFGSEPASQPIMVFHLGVRFNHPLGVFAPGAKEMGDYFTKMNNELVDRADYYGLLSFSNWRAAERGSNNTLLLIYYFRDIEGSNRFAHDELHRKAWDWFKKSDIKHIGIFHESFCTTRGAYETIYVNSNPVLLGAADTKCVDAKTGDEVWVNPLVSADTKELRSQAKRLGRHMKEDDQQYYE
jgi:fumagillin biosynthesis monooxygenase